VSGTVNVQVAASDAVGVTKVELYLDGVLVATASQSPVTFAWDTTGEANGTHTLSARAYDATGNAGTSANVAVNVQNIVVVPDTELPVAAITSPTAGTVVSKSQKVYTRTTDNAGVVRVELYLDGKLSASSTATSPTFTLNTGKWAKGAHTLKVIAYDQAGNAGVSPGVGVTK
jgi:subtilase family serine protease